MFQARGNAGVLAQAWQIQALFCEAAGIRANNSGENVASTHQQIPTGWPVALATSMPHRLGWPHKGHLHASTGEVIGDDMVASVSTRQGTIA